jgi:hypothetical protein
MANFIPESSLLNHVYIPFYKPPSKRIENCSNFFTYIEPDSNGLMSIINLVTDNTDGATVPVIPYINIGKYDSETKEWFYVDASGFPYRLFYSNSDQWYLNALWPINNINTQLIISPNAISYDSQGKNLDFMLMV